MMQFHSELLLRSLAEAQLLQQSAKANFGAEPTAPPENTDKSAMIAWYPHSGLASELAGKVQGGEEASDLHVTIIYITDDIDSMNEKRAIIERVLYQQTMEQPPLQGVISGIGKFNQSKDKGSKGAPLVALVDVPGFARFRTKLFDALEEQGVSPKMDHDFTPHITLQYQPQASDTLRDRGIPVTQDSPLTIDRVHLVWGNKDRKEFTLEQGAGQLTGESPQTIREKLQAGDHDAIAYGALLQKMWRRSFTDTSYSLAVVKEVDGQKILLST